MKRLLLVIVLGAALVACTPSTASPTVDTGASPSAIEGLPSASPSGSPSGSPEASPSAS